MTSIDGDLSLARILWIGGATDAGKTTTAKMLAERYDFQLYQYDKSSGAAARMGREKAPRSFEWAEMSIDERWQVRTPEKIAEHTLAAFEETFSVKLGDILEMTKDSMVVAEGFGFIPKLIEPLISSKRQAIWMLPTEEFKRKSFLQRGKDQNRMRDGNSDPELASYNHFTRDMLIGDYVREEAISRDLRILEIDGSLSPDEVVAIVESHFAPYLP